jgi:hypothetical protein
LASVGSFWSNSKPAALPIASHAEKQRPEWAARRRSTEILREAKTAGGVRLFVDHNNADDPNWCSHRANASIAGTCASSNIVIVILRRLFRLRGAADRGQRGEAAGVVAEV